MSYKHLLLSSFGAILWLASPLSALILLDDVMTREEQLKTGVDKLNAKQKAELERWLNENFTVKSQPTEPPPKETSLSVNINNGKQLRMNDGSLYEVAPEDTNLSASWITPFPMQITESGDPEYPVKLTNTVSGTSVRAKLVEPPTS